jgi:UDP-N-acetylmuramyl tripeptide synthase
MRDQLDRFGEIDTTAALLGQVAAATTGHAVLNRDDERIAALAAKTSAQVSYYGVAPELRPLFPNDEELYGGPISVSELPAAVELMALPSAGDERIALRIDGAQHRVSMRAEGPHNAQNAAGAAALALTFGLEPDMVLAGLAAVTPAFGRGQSFDLGGRRVVLQLVKNPAGFRQSLHTLDGPEPARAIVIAINDDYADGRDVSWLWDVDFTGLAGHDWRLITSGTRAADMAVRLRYDEVGTDEIEPDLEKAVRGAVAAADVTAHRGAVVVFCTYTAMWSLHAIMLRIAEEC